MYGNRSLITTTITAVLFILLEVCSALLIVNNGIIQRLKAVGYIHDVQSFFWEKEADLTRFLSYKSDNQALSEENVRLKNIISKYRYRAEKMDSILFAPENGGYFYIGARVVRNVINSQHNYLVLNKGEADGVQKGMGVVTPIGVVGIVENTTKNYCTVISFLNSSQNVSVKLTGSGMFGPMSWDGISTSGSILSGIPAYVEVAAGDSLVTSGYSVIYPPEIPVGTVRNTTVADGLVQNIEIDLFEDFRSLHDVYVVGNGNSEELNQLLKNE